MPSIYLFETPFSRSQDFLSLPITQIVLAIFFDSYIYIYIYIYWTIIKQFVNLFMNINHRPSMKVFSDSKL